MRRAIKRATRKFESRRWHLFAALLAQGVLTFFMAEDPEFRQAGLGVAGVAIVGVITKNPAWAESRKRWFGYVVPLLFVVVFGYPGLDNICFMIEWGIRPEPKDFAWIAPVVAGCVSIFDWRATLAVPPAVCPNCDTLVRTP